jgi:hypothetical protein
VSRAVRQSILAFLTSTRCHAFIIVVTGLVAYANSFTVPMQFDDTPVLGNAIINFSKGGLGFTYIGASRWVADVTFACNRYLHGYKVGGYHVLNLAIHIAAALSAFGLLRNVLTIPTTHDTDIRFEFLTRFLPFAVALLFVSHPLQTEAVTYIAQRYTSLTALFYLLALYSYVRARLADGAADNITESDGRKRGFSLWWLLFVLCAVLAMKCKQISITLPVMAVILEVLYFRGFRLARFRFVILMLGLLLIVPLQEVLSRSQSASPSIASTMNQISAETDTISRSSYFLTQQRVIVTYLRLLLVPVNQNLDYDYPIFTQVTLLPVLLSLLLHLTLLGVGLALLFISHREPNKFKGAERCTLRLAGLGIIWFYVTLSVESSFIPIRDVIFEHRLYLPSLGFFMTVMAGVTWLAASHAIRQKVLCLSLAAVVVALTYATIARNRIWNSEIAMWQDVVAKSPNKMRARSNAGLYFAKRLILDKSILNLVRAVELDKLNIKNRIYLNHTIILMTDFENRASSGREYQDELESVDPAKMLLWQALSYNNLGLAYEFLNRPSEAKSNYVSAVIGNPGLAIAWYNLALLAVKQHDSDGFKSAAAQLARLKPELFLKLPRPEGAAP